MKDVLLFAYGSMKRDFRNHYRLEAEEFIGEAVTKNKYNMYPSPAYNFPYGIEDDEKWQLHGELYKLTTPDLIKEIDVFEGVDKYYYRTTTTVFVGTKKYSTFIYFRSKSNPVDILDYDLPMNYWTKEFEKTGMKLDEYNEQLKIAIKDLRNSTI